MLAQGRGSKFDKQFSKLVVNTKLRLMFGVLLKCDISRFSVYSLVTSTFVPETWTYHIDSRRRRWTVRLHDKRQNSTVTVIFVNYNSRKGQNHGAQSLT